MKANYLFPNEYRKIGWVILVPSIVIGLLTLMLEYEPAFLDFNVPAIFIDHVGLFFNKGDRQLLGMVENNVLNEVLIILIIISLLFVAFSKEKIEDEYISKIRLKSLVWAVYVNYGILLLSSLFIFDLSFLWVMIFNMFTVLLFFIIKFNWQIHKIKNSTNYEE